MKTYFYIVVISVTVLLFHVGCSDDDNPVNSNSVFTMTEFPMAVGNKWVYKVNDTIQGTVDTISVLAFDTTTLFNGEFANVWIYTDTRYETHFDFVSVVGDTVKFYRDRSGVPNRILIFPIEVGNSWGLHRGIGWDTTQVTSYGTIEVPAGSFDAYRVDTDLIPMQLDAIEGSSVWISPNLGMVRMEFFSGFRVIDRYEIWELIDFLPAS